MIYIENTSLKMGLGFFLLVFVVLGVLAATQETILESLTERRLTHNTYA